jgi:hypothetical protein
VVLLRLLEVVIVAAAEVAGMEVDETTMTISTSRSTTKAQATIATSISMKTEVPAVDRL